MFNENTEELAQNKLIILYIINVADIPLDNTDITQFVLENGYMNYFMVQQYLSELFASNFIKLCTKDGHEYYKITQKGVRTLDYFSDRIPTQIKKDIDNKYDIIKNEMIKETQIIGNYYKKNNSEYIVTLKVIEKDITLFNLSLNVVSNKQAKMICETWKNNPQEIYEKVLNLLVNNK